MMSKEKQTEIKVITYEQDRLNFFTDLMHKALKKYRRIFKKHKDAPYLSEEAQILSDVARETHFYGDVVEMLEKGYRKMPDDIGEFLDGYHTFNELYHHRAVLFSVICNMFPEKAWKSKLHDTGDMFDGMFIVGIETAQGQATYHYDIEPYWDMFKVKELEKAPKWDGHTPSDAIERIGNLSCDDYYKQSDVIRCKDCKYWQDNNGGYPHEECRWGKDETPDADDFCSYGERKQ